MPKVLRIINRFNLGGPTYNAAYLTKYLSPKFETFLVGGQKDESEESSTHILDELNIDYTIIPELKREINFIDDRIAYKKMIEIIKQFQPDIVHTHASKAGTLGRLAAAKMNVPVILHTFHGHVFHSYFSKPKTVLYKNIERYLAKKSSKIIAISNLQKHELVNIHRITTANKVEVIPLGFDLSRFQENITEKRYDFRQKYDVSHNQIAIGIIGRLVPIKNHYLFIKAVASLHEKFPEVVFFIVGGGELYQTLIEYAEKLNIKVGTPENKRKGNLIFTTWIKNIDNVLAGLDIVALTSLNEGTPVSLIEAQAAGKPIVSTNVGGISDIIPKNTNDVLLSEVSNENQFIENLEKMILNVKNKTINSQELIDNAFAKYSYSRLVDNMEQLYEKLLHQE